MRRGCHETIPYKKQMNGRMPGTDTDVSQGCTFRETTSAHTLQQRFRHHPQCAIELDVGVDTVNGAGMDTFSFCTTAGNPAFQHILRMV